MRYVNYEEGRDIKKIKGSDYDAFVSACEKVKSDGYILVKASSKIKWPFFWIRSYRAKFSKSFIKIDGEVIYSRQINDSIGIRLINEA